MDYIEAIYEAKPELIKRSVHPQVVKVGYRASEKEDFAIRPMSFEKLLDLAANWSKEKKVPAHEGEAAEGEATEGDEAKPAEEAPATADA